MINDPNIAGLGGSWVTGGIGGGVAIRRGGGVVVASGSGLVNVTIGSNPIQKGYSRGLHGSVDNEKPEPPIPPADLPNILTKIVQLIGLNWSLTTNRIAAGPGVAQNDFTSLTLTNGGAPIVLLSSAATYTNNPLFPERSDWDWVATADLWFSLADSTVVTATFA